MIVFLILFMSDPKKPIRLTQAKESDTKQNQPINQDIQNHNH